MPRKFEHTRGIIVGSFRRRGRGKAREEMEGNPTNHNIQTVTRKLPVSYSHLVARSRPCHWKNVGGTPDPPSFLDNSRLRPHPVLRLPSEPAARIKPASSQPQARETTPWTPTRLWIPRAQEGKRSCFQQLKTSAWDPGEVPPRPVWPSRRLPWLSEEEEKLARRSSKG